MNASLTPMHQKTQSSLSSPSGIADRLLNWRMDLGFGQLEAVVLALYVAVLALSIPHHEPWSDEAQAWVIARDNSVWQILRYRLHYEGAPGLWHVIVHLFQLLGGRYGGFEWFGAGFGVAGIFILLRWSPFPRLIRALLPFTFFFQYQYAVVARSYVLFPLLAFCLCALFFSRRSPLWFALVAGLLANVSLQGAVFSFFLVALYLLHHVRLPADDPGNALPRRWRILRPVALYTALLLVSALTAVPAPDTDIANGGPITSGEVYHWLEYFPGSLPKSEQLPVPPLCAQRAVMALPPPPPLPPVTPRPEPRFFSHPGAWAAWYIYHDEFDAQGHILPPSTSRQAVHVLVEVLNLMTGPVSTSKLLACVFLFTLLIWLWFRRALRTLLPWISNVLVGEALWIADHHTGLLLIALLSSIWLAVQMPAPSRARRPVPLGLDRSLVVVLAIVCVLQVGWTAVVLRKDLYQSYDPGSETAKYLLQHPHERMAAFDFFATDVQPYFPHNPFFNLRHSYWVWAANDNPNGAHFTTIEQHPDLVLFSEDLLASGFMHNDWAPLSPVGTRTMERDLARNSIVMDLKAHNYRETHRFCGDRFMRLDVSYRTCHFIFEPAPSS